MQGQSLGQETGLDVVQETSQTTPQETPRETPQATRRATPQEVNYAIIDPSLVNMIVEKYPLGSFLKDNELDESYIKLVFSNEARRLITQEELNIAKKIILLKTKKLQMPKNATSNRATEYTEFQHVLSMSPVIAQKHNLEQLCRKVGRKEAQILLQDDSMHFVVRPQSQDPSKFAVSVKMVIQKQWKVGHYALEIDKDGLLVTAVQGSSEDRQFLVESSTIDQLVARVVEIESNRSQGIISLPSSQTDSAKEKSPEWQACDNLKRQLESYIKRVESHKKGNSIDFGYGFSFFRDTRAANRQRNLELSKELYRQLLEEMKNEKPVINNVIAKEKIEALRQDKRFKLSLTGIFKTSELHDILEAAKNPDKNVRINRKR